MLVLTLLDSYNFEAIQHFESNCCVCCDKSCRSSDVKRSIVSQAKHCFISLRFKRSYIKKNFLQCSGIFEWSFWKELFAIQFIGISLFWKNLHPNSEKNNKQGEIDKVRGVGKKTGELLLGTRKHFWPNHLISKRREKEYLKILVSMCAQRHWLSSVADMISFP